jgi:hypothetical protein
MCSPRVNFAACGRMQMSGTLVFPQMPHALVVRKLRRAPRRDGHARCQGHVRDVAEPVVVAVTAGGSVAELDFGDVRR